MKRFQGQAGPWLQKLKEKELASKNEDQFFSIKNARAGAPSDSLINNGVAKN
jgi:hypothetical protein